MYDFEYRGGQSRFIVHMEKDTQVVIITITLFNCVSCNNCKPTVALYIGNNTNLIEKFSSVFVWKKVRK